MTTDAGKDTENIIATKHIRNFFQFKKQKTASSGKKRRMFTSETKKTPSEIVDNGISDKTKKEDFDMVSFLGNINGIHRMYGFLYISLPVGTVTTFYFGADGQSIELKLKELDIIGKTLCIPLTLFQIAGGL